MKTINGTIFNVKVKVDRPQDDGLVKSQTEEYAVMADSFSDCEVKITGDVGFSDNTNFAVLAEAIAPYREVYIFDEGDIFYKVKITETILDEVSGKEKKTNCYYLLNATGFEQARKNIVEALGVLSDYTIAAVIEQKILEVIV